MKNSILSFVIIFLPLYIFSQSSNINGRLFDSEDQPIVYANVLLLSGVDSSMVKVETTDIDGRFSFVSIPTGKYMVKATYLAHEDYYSKLLDLQSQDIDLGTHSMSSSSIELQETVITAKRSIVEVKADRTIFNVQGTINSTGSNGLDLLRKAPGVLVDNNDNIIVLGRSGVLVYVDGKRLPLSGEDLKNYLLNLTADQIDRMDIISNPGAKYEAEGNAGIIDIRLKKNDSYGYNGSVNAGYSKGRKGRYNVGTSGNYRNGQINVFGNVGYTDADRSELFDFIDNQNVLSLIRNTDMESNRAGYNARGGIDYFINDKHTLGILVSRGDSDNTNITTSRTLIKTQATPDNIDSILIASNNSTGGNVSNTYNINYSYNNKTSTLNFDADYGQYRNTAFFTQPNTYFDSTETKILTQNNFANLTPVDIDIYTLKLDYDRDLAGGRLGFGSKYSRVETDNTFLFYNVIGGELDLDERKSNLFFYTENVYAGYVSYNRSLSEKWSMSSGVRVEVTDATGNLQALLPELTEPPVELDYTSIFPSLGLTYQVNMSDAISLNYGRRINRPDYNVLNPFEVQLSELSFSKGNAFLQPEIVNNFEVGYLLKWRYNFKLAYSKTTDQITRLLAPDDRDPRASFINWDNLAEQTIFSANISAPIEVRSFWNAYFNVSASYLDNQADYGDGVIIDLQAFSYNIFQQHTFTLPKKYTFELSGWYSGPGVWGGVFEYDSSYSLDMGISKKFLNDKLNVRVSAQDLFNQAFWSGTSNFDGLISQGQGNWDSRRVGIDVSYSFGNDKVKSRNRKAGLESESGRIGQ